MKKKKIRKSRFCDRVYILPTILIRSFREIRMNDNHEKEREIINSFITFAWLKWGINISIATKEVLPENKQ